jgi:putative DNA primase/helicase
MTDEYEEINAESKGYSAPDDWPEFDSIPPEETKTGGAQNQSIDLRQLLKEHGIAFRDSPASSQFPVKLNVQCPFDERHIGNEAFVAQMHSGALFFRCSHKDCARNGWKEFKAEAGIQSTKPKSQSAKKLMTVKACDVEPKELDWLWKDRFLIGNVNIIAGDPGLGKSLILIDIAARASSGRNFPDGSPCIRCSVLYSTTEDGIEDTVVPRLIAAAADLTRVEIVQGVASGDLETPLLLNEHMANLDQKLTENPDIRILIIDTLQSHIGSTVSTNNNSSVRGVMTPLKRLAEKHHVAVLCIEHLTKSKTTAGENATYRVQGSIAFAGAARSVWIVAKDNEDITGKRRYLQASKTNLSPDNAGIGLAFMIGGPTGRPYIHWLETDVSTSVDKLLTIFDGTDKGQAKGAVKRCCDWLTKTLTAPTPMKEIERGAKSEMFSTATLRRAKEELKITSDRLEGHWYWFPTSEMESARSEDAISAAEDVPF